MPTVGLTGDVGAGKSTLCEEWLALGAAVIDADTAARDMWADPEIQKQAMARWGSGFFDGQRRDVYKRIADKIFTDRQEYNFAARLLYPGTIAAIMAAAENAGGVVIVEMPLLFECGAESWMDAVVYAEADLKKRAERNIKRNWNEDEIKRRELWLLPREEKIKRSDIVLLNAGTEEEWRQKARCAWPEILKATGASGK